MFSRVYKGALALSLRLSFFLAVRGKAPFDSVAAISRQKEVRVQGTIESRRETRVVEISSLIAFAPLRWATHKRNARQSKRSYDLHGTPPC